MATTITTLSLPTGFLTAAYSQTVVVSGGTEPYTWSVSSGGLPTGLTLNANTGVISGTPTARGTFNFTLQATDNGAISDTESYTIIIDIYGKNGVASTTWDKAGVAATTFAGLSAA